VSDAAPYQGRHLVADLHGCSGLDDEALIRSALTRAAAAAAATLLDIRLHAFGPGQGITGVALLAESHISVHSWPEHGYAAIDIFMCGLSHDLDGALDCLVEDLGAKSVSVATLARGYASVPLVQIGEARPTNR
jgi:S-adenosylmethionine decarboxylase